MDDENQELGLFGLSSLGAEDEEGEETASITAAAEGALPYADKLRSEYEKTIGEYRTSTEDVLSQITAARKRLEMQPTSKTRGEYVRGLAEKLTAPKESTDPRFYERRNLYTFLRDVGQYGAEQSEAEKQAKLKRQEDLAKLDELKAKYRQSSALGLLKELEPAYRAAMKPATTRDSRTTDQKNADSMNMSLRDYYEWKNKQQKEGKDPNTALDQFIRARGILADPKSSPADRAAALDYIQKNTPADIRKGKMAEDKNSKGYLERITNQVTFTIPDIDSAIKQVDEGGIFAAGNLSKWLEGKPFIGQKATNLERTLESIRSKLGFDKLEELKKLSPYGASGLGAVSNAEQRLLQSVKGSVERDQSPENLRANLVRIKDFYENEVFNILSRETGIQGITGIEEAMKELDAIREGTAPSAAPAGASAMPTIDPDAIRKERERRNALRKAGGG